ncbi:hypothetical protein KTT_37460 [Tengunoibacter tsumagoiensis]|uniref:Uncharacterized protein n=1 Tax=Tengunoibacter tsumagoiensis TaxID=2014871 RepID=A0A402A403_9CHLR|nr:hypothetical protein KTT_37460 [Tengunoibacter tsumagoiensis]
MERAEWITAVIMHDEGNRAEWVTSTTAIMHEEWGRVEWVTEAIMNDGPYLFLAINRS